MQKQKCILHSVFEEANTLQHSTQTREAFCLSIPPRRKKATPLSTKANRFLLLSLSPSNDRHPPLPPSPAWCPGGLALVRSSSPAGASPSSPRRSGGPWPPPTGFHEVGCALWWRSRRSWGGRCIGRVAAWERWPQESPAAVSVNCG